jgi:hypothetical protein
VGCAKAKRALQRFEDRNDALRCSSQLNFIHCIDPKNLAVPDNLWENLRRGVFDVFWKTE